MALIGSEPTLSISRNTPDAAKKMSVYTDSTFKITLESSNLPGSPGETVFTAHPHMSEIQELDMIRQVQLVNISEPKDVQTNTNGITTATYIVTTNEHSGPFKIDFKTFIKGVGNEPLASNTVTVTGEIFPNANFTGESSGGNVTANGNGLTTGGNETVIPLRSLIEWHPRVPNMLVYANGSSPHMVFKPSERASTIPTFEIIDVTLDIPDERVSHNGFYIVNPGQRHIFRFAGDNFIEGTATGTLTIQGRTNTGEIQYVNEELHFTPLRSVDEFLVPFPINIEVEVGEEVPLNLFRIKDISMVDVDLSSITINVDGDSSEISFSDVYQENDIIKVNVEKVSGTTTQGVSVRLNANLKGRSSSYPVTASGQITTRDVTNWGTDSLSIDDILSINIPEIVIDEANGNTSGPINLGKVKLVNGKHVVDSVKIRPAYAITGGTIFSDRDLKFDEETQVSLILPDIKFKIDNFERAHGNQTIPFGIEITLQPNISPRTITETVNVPVRVIQSNTTPPAPLYDMVHFYVKPYDLPGGSGQTGLQKQVAINELGPGGQVINTTVLENPAQSITFTRGTVLQIAAPNEISIPPHDAPYTLSNIATKTNAGAYESITPNDSFTLNGLEPYSVEVNYDRSVQPVPSINANFGPGEVFIRNDQVPPTIPLLRISVSHSTKVEARIHNDTGGELIYSESIVYSTAAVPLDKWISWDQFDRQYGRVPVTVTASNQFGLVTEKTIYVQFSEAIDPPPHRDIFPPPTTPVPTETDVIIVDKKATKLDGGSSGWQPPIVDYFPPPVHPRIPNPLPDPVGPEGPVASYNLYNFITDVRIPKPAVQRGHKLNIEYDIKNVGRLLLEDGIGNVALANVDIGVESESGKVTMLNTNVPTLKRRRITINLPKGSYKVFAEVQGRTFPLRSNDTAGASHNTRLYANTILTVLPVEEPPPPEKITANEIIAALGPAVNDQINTRGKFANLISHKKVLRNLLISEDSKREYLILNYIQDTDQSVILKLYDQLGQNEQQLDSLYLAYELVDPYITTVNLDTDVINTQLSLRSPNFNIDGVGEENHSTTPLLRYDELLNYKTENDLLSISDTDLDGSGYALSGSITTDILNDVIKGRIITDEDLGIDYSNPSNFIYYSSAKERLINFKYKLGLLENYKSSRNLINSSSVSSSIAVRDEVNYYNTEINEIEATFDGYENFLYNTSGSASWPKLNGKIEPTTSSLSVNYFASQSLVADAYDTRNEYNLQKDLAEHIRRDGSNTDFLLFISMLGHHFDLIKSHVDAINRLFIRSHDSNVGTPTKLVKKLLESFGWQIKTKGAQADLANYLLGKSVDGSSKSSSSEKAREEELHRRFLNNLPYILKTKGTRASIRALFNMYGIPTSMVRIQEFGGPQLTYDSKRYYTFDDPTQLLNMSGSNQIQMDIVDTELNRKPDTYEITFRSNNQPAGHGSTASGSYQLLTGKDSSNTYFTLNVDSVPGSDFNGKLRLVISGSTGDVYVTSSMFPIFDNDLYTVGLIRERTGTSDAIDIYAKKAIYEAFTHEISASINVTASMWESASLLHIGNDFYGSVSEFRAWERPISEDVFDRHVLYNESISGDDYTSSLDELLIRIPFDRPQNLNTNTSISNFAWTGSNNYGVSAVTASNFSTVVSDPFQYEYIEIDSAVELPSIGFRADTDKIRFESQSLIDTADLNISTRITKKQFDQAPIDSNKLGVFISPVDEVNRDIARSFGGLDFMNEIGNPADYYSSSYSALNTINEHYWSRHSSGMNIYDYITLARQFDKTVFDYIDDVKPARAKLVKGLLIEQHMLERNKVKHKKPSKENMFWDGLVSTSSSFENSYPTYTANTEAIDSLVVTGSYPTYMDVLDLTDDITISGENRHWSGSIDTLLTDVSFTGSSYPTYEATIQANVTQSVSDDYESVAKLTVIGMEEEFKIPRSLSPAFAGGGYGEPQSAFGLYVQNGYSDIIFMKDGVRKVKRCKVELIELPVSSSVNQLIDGSNRGQEGEYRSVVVENTYTTLNILNVTASFTPGSTRVNGYLPFHRIYTSDLTTGLRNSYYEGSKTSGTSFVDDTKAVETFVSKPGILKVNKRGDSEIEPILQVE